MPRFLEAGDEVLVVPLGSPLAFGERWPKGEVLEVRRRRRHGWAVVVCLEGGRVITHDGNPSVLLIRLRGEDDYLRAFVRPGE